MGGMIPREHRPSSLGLENATGDTSTFEQVVDILELQPCGLGEKGVDEGHPQCVEDLKAIRRQRDPALHIRSTYGKNDERPPVDRLDGYRGDLNYCEDAHPIHKTAASQ